MCIRDRAIYHGMIVKYSDLCVILGVGCSVVVNEEMISLSLPQFFSPVSRIHANKLAITCIIDANISNKSLIHETEILRALCKGEINHFINLWRAYLFLRGSKAFVAIL